MAELCSLIFGMVIDLFRSRAALEAEIVVLRQQINVLRRANPKRSQFISIDRLILGGVCRLFPKMHDALAIVRPDTVIRWHRAGFRSYWRWKSRRRCGRSTVSLEIRRLIREMSLANPLWGAPRIHGELLKLGVDVGQTSVAKYMARSRACPCRKPYPAGCPLVNLILRAQARATAVSAQVTLVKSMPSRFCATQILRSANSAI